MRVKEGEKQNLTIKEDGKHKDLLKHRSATIEGSWNWLQSQTLWKALNAILPVKWKGRDDVQILLNEFAYAH